MTDLRSELLADWRRFGDVGCLATLLSAVPLRLPPAVVRRERDRRIRIIAAPLVAKLTVCRAAAILAELGQAAEQNRPPRLGGADVSDLVSEIAAARREIGRILSWSAIRNGRKWPTARHLIRLLHD